MFHPIDQKFATFEDLNKHYTLFLNRIQTQISTLGGGGAVNIRDLDDVDQSTARVNNKFLKYDSASGNNADTNRLVVIRTPFGTAIQDATLGGSPALWITP